MPDDERDPAPSPPPDAAQPPAGKPNEPRETPAAKAPAAEAPAGEAPEPDAPESAPPPSPPASPDEEGKAPEPAKAAEQPAEAATGDGGQAAQAVKGDIVEVTVRRIAPFGAFVRLPDGRKGLIHISQVAEEFVDDIKQHLEVGQTVRARVTAVAEDGKVDLSIKKAKPRPKPKQSSKPKKRKSSERDRDRAEAKPPNKADSFHVNPLSDVLMDVEKKLK